MLILHIVSFWPILACKKQQNMKNLAQKITLGLLVLVFTVTLVSCKSTQIGMANADTQLQLRKFDLDITDQKTATAMVTKIIGIDFQRLFNVDGANYSRNGYAAGLAIPVIGAEIVTSDQAYALRNLINDHMGTEYDMIMYPKFQRKMVTYFGFYTVTETTVTARFARLKK